LPGRRSRQSNPGAADDVPAGERRLFTGCHLKLQIARNNQAVDLSFRFLSRGNSLLVRRLEDAGDVQQVPEGEAYQALRLDV
jgi:hypothetical protein